MTKLAKSDQPAGLTKVQIDLLKRTIAIGATDDELAMFMHVAKKTGLDPFMRQIYLIKRKAKNADGEYEDRATIQTGIDGYRLIASRTGEHAGTDDAVFEDDKDGRPMKATVTVWRKKGNERYPYTATARWNEYVQTAKAGYPMGLWGRMPHAMLAKVAEALALRKAFPDYLSGILAAEEITEQPVETEKPTEEPKKLPETQDIELLKERAEIKLKQAGLV